jgi:hypothetical protein
VAPILPEVDRDAVGAGKYREMRGPHRIRVMPAAGVSDRCNVVDVDAEAEGIGSHDGLQ